MNVMPMNSAPSMPLNLVLTEQIQKVQLSLLKFLLLSLSIPMDMSKSYRELLYRLQRLYLDENKNLIMAILESQNTGKVTECAQYQAILQKNLMYLAAIANASFLDPEQYPSSVPQAQMQAQHGGPIPKVPFQLNAVKPQDQHFQHIQGQFSGANNNGMHFLMQPGLGGSGGGSREGHGSLGLGHVEGRD
ncbi:GRF1-interacting factor 2 [Striga asiatica]|uniref:GRF1-interacting factor 2 n=1 Tax=Striga asiatica TaxID=4170 RepID=A0A5A7PCX7_STRAF|nr:GRF1-interacting factor 2 [Striga asiatica]